VIIAGLLLQGVVIAWPSRNTGKQGKGKDHIAKRNRKEDKRKTAELLKRYLDKYRRTPKFGHGHSLFINQRGEQFTRHGINRICKKYLRLALPGKRLEVLNPVHSFRHSCAMNMLANGAPITDIKNRLGHENINSTMVYLKMEMRPKREVQKKFLEHTQSILSQDSKIEELNPSF
jgi:integrase